MRSSSAWRRPWSWSRSASWAPTCAARERAFAAGLEWAIEQGLQVCNLSLSSKSEALYPVFHDLADRAYFRGTALVSAANNVAGAELPVALRRVFSVAAHGEPDPWRIYYNPAPPVEFGAWGVDVPVAWKDGGGYGRHRQQLRGTAHRRHWWR